MIEGKGTDAASARGASTTAEAPRQTDPAALARRAGDAARGELGGDLVVVDLFDEPAGQYWPIYVADGGGPIEGAPMPQGRGVIGLAIRERRPIVVEDYQAWGAAHGWSVGLGIASALAVPVLVGAEPVGAVAVGFRARRRIDERMVARLEAIAADLTPGLAAASAGPAVDAAAPDEPDGATDELLQLIADAVGPQLGADRATVALLEPGGAARVRAAWGVQSATRVGLLLPPGDGVVGRVVAEGATVRLRGLGVDPTLSGEQFAGILSTGARTAIGTPLRLGDRLAGALIAMWRADVELTETHVAQLEAQAARAGAVLERSQAFARERTLRELTGALAANLDEKRVVELAVDHATRLLAAPYARVWLAETSGDLRCAAARGWLTAETVGERLPRASVSGAVVGGEPLNLPDAEAHPAWFERGFAGRTGLGTFLGMPIRRAGIGLGTLEVMRERGRPFDAADELLLRTLADAVAVAVANARSYRAAQNEVAERERAEATVRRLAEQRKRLLELSRALISTLALDEVIERLLRTQREVVPYDVSGLYQVDEPAGQLRPIRVVGDDGATELGAVPLALGEGIIGGVAVSGRAELVNDAHLDPRSVYPDGVRFEREHLIVVPIRAQERTVAVLVLGRTGDAGFADDERELVELFASHASIALEHARLFEQTRESEEKYRALFEGSRDAVYICAADGSLVDVNQACVEMLGYASREELIGLRVTREVYADHDDVERLRAALAEADYVRDFPAMVRRKDGTIVHTVQTTTVERGPDGAPRLYRGVARDVTDALRAQAALREAERREAQSDKLRSLGQMASGIAHDLNQQLGLVVGHGELALRDLEAAAPGLDGVRDSLRTVVHAAMDGAETVKRLLAFARADAEGPAERVDLGELLAEVAKLTAPRWRDAAQLEGRPIGLTVSTTGETAVDGWAASLREALANLVLNAVDALPRGGTIGLTARPLGDRVEVAVADDGVGMPPDVRNRIFEPFFSTKGEGGTGLGLPIVFSIVERHRGTIAVESEPGRGTRFVLTFPAGAAAGAAAPAPERPSRAGSLRVLAVDDEPELRVMMARMLSQAGHRVTEAASGEEALERLGADSYDVVVSDVGMGAGMNGWELAETVRTRWPEIRFILATGWGAQIEPGQAARYGVEAVVAKPYRITDLLRAVGGRTMQP